MVSGYRVFQVQQYSGISNAVKCGQLSGLKETVTINMFQSLDMEISKCGAMKRGNGYILGSSSYAFIFSFSSSIPIQTKAKHRSSTVPKKMVTGTFPHNS